MRTIYLDIDGTLVEDGLWSLLIRQLRAEDLGDAALLDACLEDLVTPGRSGMAAVLKYIPDAVRNIHPHDCTAAVGRAWNSVPLMPFTQDLTRFLRERDLRVVMISGAPQVLADRLGSLYTVDRVFACTILPGMPDFLRFVGSREAKAELVHLDARLKGVDLSTSIAVGNGFNDMGLLAEVGHPLAFEPSGRLHLAALEAGWPVADRHTLLGHLDRLLDLS